MADAELVGCAQRGDPRAFEALVARYRGRVYGLCLHKVGDPDEAADLAQESFVRAYQQIGQVRQPEAFAGWLRRVAANVCNAWLRRTRPLVVDPETLAEANGSSETVEAAAERRLAAGRVRQALAVLSEPVRLTVTLFYMDGYSYQEIARFLEAPVETVRGRLRDARRRLRKELWDMAGETVRAGQPGPEFEQAVVRRVEVSDWCRSFAEMIAAGVSLVRALAILEQDPFSDSLTAATRRVRKAIEGGATLSAALHKEPDLRSPMILGMVRAGEVGGVLDKTLAMLDQWQRIDEAARRTELALWCRTLGTLLASGVPILQALEMVAGLATSEGLREATLRMRAAVREARSLGDVIYADADLFPTEIALLLVASECSGELDTALLDASALLIAELARAVGPPEAAPGPRRYLGTLRALLHAPAPDRRVEAAAAIGRGAEPDTVPPLADALRTRHPGIGPSVVRLFETLSAPDALSLFVAAGQDQDPQTRLAAARALAGHRAPEARDALAALAGDADARVRRAGIRCFATDASPADIPQLAGALADPDPRVAAIAAEGLGRIGPPAAEALLGASASPRPETRVRAALAMAHIDVPAIRQRLRSLLEDDDRWVRANAADALGTLRDRESVTALIRLAESEGGDVSPQTIRALGMLGDTRAAPMLVDILGRGDHAARWAADALAAIGDASAIPPLRVLFRDAGLPEATRSAAMGVLAALGDREIAVEIAERMLQPGAGWPDRNALARVATVPAIRCLLDALSGADPERRRRAATALAGLARDASAAVRPALAAAETAPALAQFRNDPDPRVQKHVRTALAGPPSAG